MLPALWVSTDSQAAPAEHMSNIAEQYAKCCVRSEGTKRIRDNLCILGSYCLKSLARGMPCNHLTFVLFYLTPPPIFKAHMEYLYTAQAVLRLMTLLP